MLACVLAYMHTVGRQEAMDEPPWLACGLEGRVFGQLIQHVIVINYLLHAS